MQYGDEHLDINYIETATQNDRHTDRQTCE